MIKNIDMIYMDIIYSNHLKDIDEFEWNDGHADDKGEYISYEKFSEMRDDFLNGKMTGNEMIKFMGPGGCRLSEPYPTLTETFENVIYSNFIYPIDRSDWNNKRDYADNKESFPSYEEFCELRTKFGHGEMTEREIKDFMVTCNLADPSDYPQDIFGPDWYYSSDASYNSPVVPHPVTTAVMRKHRKGLDERIINENQAKQSERNKKGAQ